VLDAKTILVVDEAGMVGTRQMKALLDACKTAGAKLVLVGDARQLQPIEAGGPFAALAKVLGQAVLTEIHRQREAWAKSAVLHLAAGEAGTALAAYAERGLVAVEKTRAEAQRRLIATWARHGVSRPAEHLILTGDNAEARELNRLAQDERLRWGKVGREFVRVGASDFHVGDRVLFTRNSRGRTVSGRFQR
jgi:ATP-dependent exoDNAse (exonuclease V) alpha subunit